MICVSPEYSLVPDNYWGDGKEGHLLDFCFSTLELHCLTDILKEQQAKLVFGVDEEVYEFCSRSLLHPFFSHYMTSPLTLWTKESSASLPPANVCRDRTKADGCGVLCSRETLICELLPDRPIGRYSILYIICMETGGIGPRKGPVAFSGGIFLANAGSGAIASLFTPC